MKLSCEKAAEICTKTQYGEASFTDKLKLSYHLFVCKTCAKFSKQNTEFTSICENANIKSLSQTQKEAMKNALKQNL